MLFRSFVMSPFNIKEPVFLRGKEYTLRSECGSVVAEEKFLVGQRMTLSHFGDQEFEFLTNPENVDTFSIWGLMILLFCIILLPAGALFYYLKR